MIPRLYELLYKTSNIQTSCLVNIGINKKEAEGLQH